jgi:hypothetical protein
MKVRMVLTVSLNDTAQAAWMENYGVSKDEIREDVKRYMAGQIVGDNFQEIIGVPIDVSWK